MESDRNHNYIIQQFFIAVYNKNLEAIKELLEDSLFLREQLVSNASITNNLVSNHRLDVLQTLYPFHTHQKQFLETCLLIAVDVQNIDIVKFSIDNGVDVNCNTQEALHRVVGKDNGNIDILKLLLSYNTKLDTASSNSIRNGGPFYEAVKNSHYEIVKLLMPIQKVVNFHDYNILKSVQKNEQKTNEILKFLVEYDLQHNKYSVRTIFDKFRSLALRFSSIAQDDARDSNYVFGSLEELLRESAKHGNVEMIEFLIEKGINKNIIHWHGNEESKAFASRYELNHKLDRTLQINTIEKKNKTQENNHIKRHKI